MISPDSPFTPARPAAPDLFIEREGLIHEIRQLAWRCFNKKHVEMAFVCGERGMGKSSLVRKICHDLKNYGLEEKNESKFLTAEVNLCGINAIEKAFILTFSALLKDKQGDTSKVDFKIGINVGLLAMKWSLKSKDINRISQEMNFAETLVTLEKQIDKDSKGIVVFWDDFSGFVESPDFPFWLKRFAESNVGFPILLIMTCSEKVRKEIAGKNLFAEGISSVSLDAAHLLNSDIKKFLCEGLGKFELSKYLLEKLQEVGLPKDSLKRLKQGKLPEDSLEKLQEAGLSEDSLKKLIQGKFPENLIPQGMLDTLSGACIDAPVFAQKIGDAIWRALPKLINIFIEKGEQNFLSEAFDEVAKNIGIKCLGKNIISKIDSKSYILLLGLLHKLSVNEKFSRQDVLSKLPKGVTQSKAKEFFKCMRKSGALIALQSPRGMYRLRVV